MHPVLQGQVGEMEGLLEEKNVELDGLREQLVQVTSDFKYNLKVGCTRCCLSLNSCSSGEPTWMRR